LFDEEMVVGPSEEDEESLKDDGIRPNSSLKTLSKLSPAFSGF